MNPIPVTVYWTDCDLHRGKSGAEGLWVGLHGNMAVVVIPTASEGPDKGFHIPSLVELHMLRIAPQWRPT